MNFCLLDIYITSSLMWHLRPKTKVRNRPGNIFTIFVLRFTLIVLVAYSLKSSSTTLLSLRSSPVCFSLSLIIAISINLEVKDKTVHPPNTAPSLHKNLQSFSVPSWYWCFLYCKTGKNGKFILFRFFLNVVCDFLSKLLNFKIEWLKKSLLNWNKHFIVKIWCIFLL